MNSKGYQKITTITLEGASLLQENYFAKFVYRSQVFWSQMTHQRQVFQAKLLHSSQLEQMSWAVVLIAGLFLLSF
jgi:hypothetical protein